MSKNVNKLFFLLTFFSIGCLPLNSDSIDEIILGTWYTIEEVTIKITEDKLIFLDEKNKEWGYELGEDSMISFYGSPYDSVPSYVPQGMKIIEIKLDTLVLYDSLFSKQELLIRIQ